MNTDEKNKLAIVKRFRYADSLRAIISASNDEYNIAYEKWSVKGTIGYMEFLELEKFIEAQALGSILYYINTNKETSNESFTGCEWEWEQENK